MKMKILSKSGLKVVDLNRRKAIRERCLNCSAWVSREVLECSFLSCPLFQFRMGTEKQNPKRRKNAIRKYCLWCMTGQQSEIGKCVSIHCPLFPFRQSSVDRSQEIASLSEKHHIETSFQAESSQGIPQHG